MSSSERTVPPSSRILAEALDAGRLTRMEVTRALNLGSRQNVTNWLAHGVPARHLPGVARLCGMSTDEYRARSGLTEACGSILVPADSQTEKLLANFAALPPALQVLVLRRVKEMRKYVDTLPSFLRHTDLPGEPDRLRDWEREFFKAIEAHALEAIDGEPEEVK